MEDFKVNESVFLKPIGNQRLHVRRDIEEHILEAKIIKIAKKYIFVDPVKRRSPMKFYIDTLIEANDLPNWKLYINKEDILDEIESENLITEIGYALEYSNRKKMTLDQLKRIKKIIEENNN